MAWSRVLVLAAAVGAVACGSASAATHATAKAPAPLVGAWGRAMTAADWSKVGIATEPPAHISMLVSADGSVVMGESIDVRIVALANNRARISGVYGCGKKSAVYHWSVANRRLTFMKVQDTCNYSLALFGGPWTRQKV